MDRIHRFVKLSFSLKSTSHMPKKNSNHSVNIMNETCSTYQESLVCYSAKRKIIEKFVSSLLLFFQNLTREIKIGFRWSSFWGWMKSPYFRMINDQFHIETQFDTILSDKQKFQCDSCMFFQSFIPSVVFIYILLVSVTLKTVSHPLQSWKFHHFRLVCSGAGFHLKIYVVNSAHQNWALLF